VDTATGLGDGHALHAVYAALVLEPGVGVVPLDLKDHFFVSADAGLIGTQQGGLPTLGSRIQGVHTVKIGREQGRFISSGSGTDLHDDVFGVPGISGDKQVPQLGLRLLQRLLSATQFLIDERHHLGVLFLSSQVARIRNLTLERLIALQRLRHRLELGKLLPIGAQPIRIANDLWRGKQSVEFIISRQDGAGLFIHRA